MATITEDYISFETAKLLKEKGFSLPSTNFEDWLCCMYDKNGNIQWGCYHSDYYARVTLQMAMRWLREVHKLFIDTYYDCDFAEGYKFSVHKLPKGTTLESHNENYSTYEQASEAAIKYCLENLI